MAPKIVASYTAQRPGDSDGSHVYLKPQGDFNLMLAVFRYWVVDFSNILIFQEASQETA
jgi:hypothetical protein